MNESQDFQRIGYSRIWLQQRQSYGHKSPLFWYSMQANWTENPSSIGLLLFWNGAKRSWIGQQTIVVLKKIKKNHEYCRSSSCWRQVINNATFDLVTIVEPRSTNFMVLQK